MFRKRGSRTPKDETAATDPAPMAGDRSDDVPSRNGARLDSSLQQDALEQRSIAAWRRYASMKPHEDKSAVTYRAGHRTAPGARTSNHPYGAEQTGKSGNPRAFVPTGPNYYTLLGIDYRASGEEIERAFRRLVVQMHPDKFFADPERHAEAIEQLKDLNAIMRVLRDPIQRAEYDALLLSDRVPPLTRRMAAMRIKR